MPLLRRAAPVDPHVVGRLAAVLGRPGPGDAPPEPGSVVAGWVPPRTASAGSEVEPTPVRRAGRPGRGRHGARATDPAPAPNASTARSPADDEAVVRRPWTWSALEPPDPGPPTGPVPDPTARAAPARTVLRQWRQGRVDPGRRGLVALVVVALLAAGLAGLVVLRARPHVVAPPTVVAAGVPVPGGRASATAPAAGDVVVAVSGLVLHPGLLRLPAGSRVDDAVRAAGGAQPGADLDALNLARRLVDGEQVLVGVPQVAQATAPSGGGPAPGALVDLNTATAAQFDALPGIGPVLAQKLVDWRGQHGRFGSVDQLREVSGIGESKYDEIKDKVRV